MILPLDLLILTHSEAALAALVTTAACKDVRTRRIPNALVLTGTAIAFALHGLDASGWLTALAGWAVGFAALLPLYLLRGCGAGDVKLLAMAGAFAGPKAALGIVLATFVAGAVLALLYALRRGAGLLTLKNLHLFACNAAARLAGAPGPATLAQQTGRIPYAVAIALGMLAWFVAIRIK